MQNTAGIQAKKISSPTELESNDFIRLRGRILGSGKVGKRPGLIVLGIGCLLLAAIAYGIAHSGIRRPIGLSRREPVAIAPGPNAPWWQSESDAIRASGPATPKETPTTPHLPPGVPDLGQVDDPPRTIVTNPQLEAPRVIVRPATDIPVLPPIPRIVDPPQFGPIPTGVKAQSVVPDVDVPNTALHDALAAPPLVVSGLPDAHPRGLTQMARVSPAPGVTSTENVHQPFEISAGTMIPAALLTAIDSDVPGLLVAQVRQNTYDTVTGRYLLIPQGAKLIGMYDSRIAYGQNRLVVAWRRLLFPDGSSIELQNMAGADLSGRSGFDAQVDNHTKKLFQGAILLSIIGAGAQLSQPQQTSVNGAAPSVGQVIAGSVGSQIATTGTHVVQRQLNVQPNLRVPTGYEFNVTVDHDLVLSGPYPWP